MKLFATRNALQFLAFHMVSRSKFDKSWAKEGSCQPHTWLPFL